MMKKMKNSGIEWIGDIPEEWSFSPLKKIVSMNSSALPEDTDPNYEFDYVDIGSVSYDKGIERMERMSFKNSPSRARRVVFDGDIIVSTVRTYLRAIASIENPKKLIVSTGFAVLTPAGILSDYLKYSVLGEYFVSMVEAKSSGISYPAINATDMGSIKTLVPPLHEQQRIADYLDKKCTMIDETMEREKQVIEKLKAYKQSVITEAVTKGLNPNAPMKKSGIEWIGKIPAAWEVRRLRYVGSCQNGISKGGEFFGTGSPFVSYGDVYKNMALPERIEGLIQSTDDEQENYSVTAGDIFFTRTSETIEEIGLTSVCMKTIPQAAFAGFLIRVRPFVDTLEPEYSKYYFRSYIHRRFLVKEMDLVIRASLGQELLKRLPVLLPSLNEQCEIADYLDKKCAGIDTAIAKKEALIAKLAAYKKSLIYECVTGKKEVV